MKQTSPDTGASWWREMLNRREANKRIAQIGATAALLATAGITVVGCGDEEDDGEILEKDALETQKSMGWNAGATEQHLKFSSPSGTDSQNALNWSAYLDPSALLQAYQPKNSAWKPYVVPTLIQSLSQKTLKSEMQPFHSKSMDEAYSRGLGMKEILANSKDAGKVMVIADLPGPEAVAYGAALADIADVIVTFDNWPHPTGVVPTHETLGAMLYYADEIKQKAAKRPDTAPAVLILDSNRLTPYNDDSDTFDNRYIAKIPTVENLQTMKVSSVLYAVPDDKRTAELDDINEDFVAYKEKGINVAMMPLTNFQPPSAAVQDSLANARKTTNQTGGVYHSTYYYGGHPMFSPWFYSYYPMYAPVYGYSRMRGSAPSSIRNINYTPSSRPTVFSSRTVGTGRSGVGKQRPTGFGRVSTRTSSSGRTYVGSRSSVRSSGSSGRSGSFGRSGSRGYSG